MKIVHGNVFEKNRLDLVCPFSYKKSMSAPIAVNEKAIRNAVHSVLAEYQEYGADPSADAVSYEAIIALYGETMADSPRSKEAREHAKKVAAELISAVF